MVSEYADDCEMVVILKLSSLLSCKYKSKLKMFKCEMKNFLENKESFFFKAALHCLRHPWSSQLWKWAEGEVFY